MYPVLNITDVDIVVNRLSRPLPSIARMKKRYPALPLVPPIPSPFGSAAELPAARAVPALIGLCGACVALGFAVVHAPLLAFVSLALFLGVALFALAGPTRVTHLALVSLPLLVLLINLTPRLTLTLTAAATVLLLLATTPHRFGGDALTWTGVSMFVVILLVHLIQSTSGEQFVAAAKYSLFPAMAVVVSTKAGRERLVEIRWLLLGGGVATMAVQGATILLHVGATGAYYGAGEQLGLTSESPHELALIGVTVAVACLIAVRDVRWRLAGAAIAAAPALATGVRSALVALALAAIALVVRSRFRPGTVVSIAAIAGVIVFGGVGSIIVARFEKDQKQGEYSNVAKFGSGRGSLWTAALDRYGSSGPSQVVFGSGLRSIERVEEQAVHQRNSVQSDPLTVMFELGIFGLVAWLLIWAAIIRSRVNWLILLPLATYALTNGSLEYVGAIVYCIALAAAFPPVPVRRLATGRQRLPLGDRSGSQLASRE